MHLQYRIKLASGGQHDAPGAAPADLAESDPIEARPGLLAELARRISDAGIDIRLVSGRGIETGGILVLAVNDEHGPHGDHSHSDPSHSDHSHGDRSHSDHSHADDREKATRQSKGHGGSRGHDHTGSPENGDSDDAKLKALLDEHRYRYERVAPTLSVLEDRIGALADWAEGIAKEGRLVDTIALGTPESHGEEGEQIPLQATTIACGTAVGAEQRETVTSGAP